LFLFDLLDRTGITIMDKFTLQGITYYKQFRKCGKPDCRCKSGELHGPYWYSRNTQTGKLSYVGRRLPRELEEVRAAHARLFTAMQDKRRDLLDQAATIERLINHEPLSAADIEFLTRIGFAQCLVSDGSRSQEDQYKLPDPTDPKNYAQPILV
jgi:hypothetical protein